MKYYTNEDGLASAHNALMTEGGQLFTQGRIGGAHIHVCGSRVTTYWDKNSKLRAETELQCKALGIDPENMTPGRICKVICDDIVQIPYTHTKFDTRWRKAAINGSHWHYYHVKPNNYEWCLELDLKGAYMTSLFRGDSLLWNESKGYRDDDGALERLQALNPHLEKWCRLTLLGKLAAHEMSYLIRDPESELGWSRKTHYKITYGAAFNATHRAIARLYKVMQECHEILGEHLIRAHTDGLLISMNLPLETEQKLYNFLGKLGYETTCKKIGRAYLWDLNTGIIGTDLIGTKEEVYKLMRRDGVKFKKDQCPQIYEGRWRWAYEQYKAYKASKQSVVAGTFCESHPDVY